MTRRKWKEPKCGKGDRNRTTDFRKYRDNFDAIFSGTCKTCGGSCNKHKCSGSDSCTGICGKTTCKRPQAD